ncbi:Uncharacterised protein [Neisseria meningitidis]|nr:Uncharacterised protein [Neisseria meningitidis]
MRNHIENPRQTDADLLRRHIIFAEGRDQEHDKRKRAGFQKIRQPDGRADFPNLFEHRPIRLAEFRRQFERAEEFFLGDINPQRQRAEPKHHHRRQPAARAAQSGHAEFAVNENIVQRHVQHKRRKADQHNQARAVQAGSVGVQRAVHHCRRHRQTGEQHILRHRAFHIIAQGQPVAERRNRRPHQYHAENPQKQPEPNPLPPRFAHFTGFTRAVKLGNHRVQCRHNAHKGNINRGKRAAAQGHRRQILFARTARHHGIDETDAYLRDLRQQHGQGKGGQQADFFQEDGKGKAVEVEQHKCSINKNAV